MEPREKEPPMTEAERARREAAEMLRMLLDAQARGDLEAPGPQGARLARRMEGAATALEISSRPETQDEADVSRERSLPE